MVVLPDHGRGDARHACRLSTGVRRHAVLPASLHRAAWRAGDALSGRRDGLGGNRSAGGFALAGVPSSRPAPALRRPRRAPRARRTLSAVPSGPTAYGSRASSGCTPAWTSASSSRQLRSTFRSAARWFRPQPSTYQRDLRRDSDLVDEAKRRSTWIARAAVAAGISWPGISPTTWPPFLDFLPDRAQQAVTYARASASLSCP